ncbi:MAG: peptide chain release factor N(5)-glutamine methyltransferase [Oligoflexales bacterium]
MTQLPLASSIGEARTYCKSKLDSIGIQSSAIDTDLLLSSTLNVSRIHLYAYPEQAISKVQCEQLLSLLNRRLQDEPMAYILGEREFFGRSYAVDHNVLIPRPETELLVETTLNYLNDLEHARVLEIGTGSGCVAISLDLESVDTTVESWDYSHQALGVAKKNSSRLGANVSFIQKDALKPCSWNTQEKFDLLVSNPPYIAWSEFSDIESGVRDYEPHEALFAEEDGLAFYKTFAQKGPMVLKPKGLGIFEIGFAQADKITEVFKMFGWEVISVIKDYMSKHRLVVVSYSDKS